MRPVQTCESMSIPTSRADLIESMKTSFASLRLETEKLDEELAALICVDDWSIKDLLSVRLWWTDKVCEWIDAGLGGSTPVLPAPGYSWRETPRLNADIIAQSRDTSLSETLGALEDAFNRALATADSLSDRELLARHEFEWAGKLPLVRWISINTTRQYVTARTYIRRALRNSSGDMNRGTQ